MSTLISKWGTASLVIAAVLLAGCQASEAESTAKAETAAEQTKDTLTPEAAKIKEAAKVSTAETPVTPQLKLQSLGDNLYVIFGPGGNIGVSVGADGVILIDDKFERNADEILSLLKGLTDEPLRYVVNTHYHGDHTGSNGQMKTAGATLVAHDNVRTRMGMRIKNKLFNRTGEPSPETNWPSLTFSDDMTLHLNDQTLTALHTPGHTDGDSLVHFKEANVIHMGDNFFNGLFPYIDIDAGGSVSGMIAAHDKALSLADENTKIIPGHGPLSTKADLQKARDMLADIMDRVKVRMVAGDTLEIMIESKILQDYSDYASFIDEKNMIKIAHRSLSSN